MAENWLNFIFCIFTVFFTDDDLDDDDFRSFVPIWSDFGHFRSFVPIWSDFDNFRSFVPFCSDFGHFLSFAPI